MVIKKELCLFVCLCKDFINTYIPITSVVTILSLQTYLHPCQLPFVTTGELYIYIYILKWVNIFFISFNVPFLLKRMIIYLYILLLKLMDISPFNHPLYLFILLFTFELFCQNGWTPSPQLILPFSFCKPNFMFAKLFHLWNG